MTLFRPFGFSLLELLLVLALTLLLASIAYPSYQHHLSLTYRDQAKMSLLQLAAQLEAYYTAQQSYEGATLANLGLSNLAQDNHYQYAIAAQSEQSYTAMATPLGQQAKQDLDCATLSINQLGELASSGVADMSLCW